MAAFVPMRDHDGIRNRLCGDLIRKVDEVERHFPLALVRSINALASAELRKIREMPEDRLPHHADAARRQYIQQIYGRCVSVAAFSLIQGALKEEARIDLTGWKKVALKILVWIEKISATLRWAVMPSMRRDYARFEQERQAFAAADRMPPLAAGPVPAGWRPADPDLPPRVVPAPAWQPLPADDLGPAVPPPGWRPAAAPPPDWMPAAGLRPAVPPPGWRPAAAPPPPLRPPVDGWAERGRSPSPVDWEAPRFPVAADPQHLGDVLGQVLAIRRAGLAEARRDPLL